MLLSGKQLLFLLFLLVLGVSGCAVSRGPVRMPPLVTVEGVEGHFYPGQIISLKEGRALSFEELMTRLTRKRLVFVGEVHSNPEDHLIEIQILQALMASNPPPDVAMEFFQVDQQQAIDDYLRGATSETQFLKDVRWRETWNFPYRFYRPLVLALRQGNRHLYAINVPRNIVKKVARKGLHSLDPRERKQIAKHIDLSNKEHRAFLEKVFQRHAHGDLGNFEYFYQAQCVWEDTMAERVAELLAKSSRPLVVFAGNGHILNRYGIPDRVIKRTAVPMATVAIHAVHGPISFHRHAADFLWLTGMLFSPRPGKKPLKKTGISDIVTHPKSKKKAGPSG